MEIHDKELIVKLGAGFIGTLGIIGLSAWAVFDDAALDILGDSTTNRSSEEAQQIATEYYNQEFANLSPADKYIFQFLGTTVVRVDARPGGNGILGAFTEQNSDYRAEFNNACLNGTAFDIDGGSVDVSVGGFFTRASAQADIPTAAAFAQINVNNEDQLIVRSGNAHSTDLLFNGLTDGSELTPANEETERILETYGCRVGQLDPISLVNSNLFAPGQESL